MLLLLLLQLRLKQWDKNSRPSDVVKFGDTRNNTYSENSYVYLSNWNGSSVTLFPLSMLVVSRTLVSSSKLFLLRLRSLNSSPCNMVHLTVSSYLWIIAVTGLYVGLNGSFTSAVMIKSKNDTSRGNSNVIDGGTVSLQDGLEASQSRVNEHPSSDNYYNKRSNHRVSSKGEYLEKVK